MNDSKLKSKWNDGNPHDITCLSERDQRQAIHGFAEGNRQLERFLLNCKRNNVITTCSCGCNEADEEMGYNYICMELVSSNQYYISRIINVALVNKCKIYIGFAYDEHEQQNENIWISVYDSNCLKNRFFKVLNSAFGRKIEIPERKLVDCFISVGRFLQDKHLNTEIWCDFKDVWNVVVSYDVEYQMPLSKFKKRAKDYYSHLGEFLTVNKESEVCAILEYIPVVMTNLLERGVFKIKTKH